VVVVFHVFQGRSPFVSNLLSTTFTEADLQPLTFADVGSLGLNPEKGYDYDHLGNEYCSSIIKHDTLVWGGVGRWLIITILGIFSGGRSRALISIPAYQSGGTESSA
jgi:hypothetical protein